VASTQGPQRRKANRKQGDRRIVRVEAKDYLGNPRYVTADLLNSSEMGLGIVLRTPLTADSVIVVRTNLDPAKPNAPRRVRVSWCEEQPDSTFHAGLQYL